MSRAPVLAQLLTTLALALAVTDAAGKGADRSLTIFYTAEVHGTLEPCGCTSDPLGDVARYAEVVRAATRSEAVLMVDAGGLSFPETSTPKEREANGLRARFLTRAMEGMGPPFVAGLAETDVAPDATVSPRRLAVNLAAPAATAPSFLATVGGVFAWVSWVSPFPRWPRSWAARARSRSRLRAARSSGCGRPAPSW